MKTTIALLAPPLLLLLGGVFDVVLAVKEPVRHMGCYALEYSLSKLYHHRISNTNLTNCISLCRKQNTRYAGVEQSDDLCYCGSDIPEISQARDNSLCNYPCVDDKSQKCGGYSVMSVYSLDDSKTNVPAQTTTQVPESNVDQNIGFLFATTNGISMCSLSDLKNKRPITVPKGNINSVDYHFAKNLVFANMGQSIYKTNLKHKSSSTEASPTGATMVGLCASFVVDWEGARLYWARCQDNSTTIMSWDLTGSDEVIVLSRPGIPVKVRNMAVDPYKRLLFWTGDGVIESCTLSGSDFRTNMSGPEILIRAMTLDLSARRLYYVSNRVDWSSGPHLYSMDYQGSDSKQHFALGDVYGLGVFKSYVFWVEKSLGSIEVLYQSPINLNNVNQMKLLVFINQTGTHMRLVHPELQTRPPNEPCDDKGCSHSCVVFSGVPRCICPLLMKLDSDSITCINSAKENPSVNLTTMKPVKENTPTEIKTSIQATSQREFMETTSPGASVDESSTEEMTKEGLASKTNTPSNTGTGRGLKNWATVLHWVMMIVAMVTILGLLYLGWKDWPTLLHNPYAHQPLRVNKNSLREQPDECQTCPQSNTMDDHINLL